MQIVETIGNGAGVIGLIGLLYSLGFDMDYYLSGTSRSIFEPRPIPIEEELRGFRWPLFLVSCVLIAVFCLLRWELVCFVYNGLQDRWRQAM